ncbi:MAG: hypothetical protein U9O55_02970 [Patescibacteria group bacterium]|nr:hypothetical protein [Patescibacteria group bacterium]
MPEIYNPPVILTEKEPETKLVPVSEINKPDTTKAIVPTPSVRDNISQRLTALEKRMSSVEKKTTTNSADIQSVTMRVAEMKILSEMSSDYMACIVGNFKVGQSNITDDLGSKIVNKCLPYFKEEANKKGNDYKISYILGYGDIGGRTDITEAISQARSENIKDFLLNNDSVAKKTINAQIVVGGPTAMFGHADYNRCVVIVAEMVYKSTISILPKTKQ